MHRLEACPGGLPLPSSVRRKFLREQGLDDPEHEHALRLKGFAIRPYKIQGPCDDPTQWRCYHRDRQGEVLTSADIHFTGHHIYTDGSCTKFMRCPCYNRAGWAVVQIDPVTGELLWAMYGPVLAEWPQTSPMAEIAALNIAALQAAQGARVKIDWSGAVDLWAAPSRATSPGCFFAGPMRQALATNPGLDASWIPGHVAKTDFPELSREWLDVVGNDWADHYAKEGAALHPVQGQGEAHQAVEQAKLHLQLLTHIGQSLALWAKDDTEKVVWRTGRARKPARLRLPRDSYMPRISPDHVWSCSSFGSQRCIRCLGLRSRSAKTACNPSRHFIHALLDDPKGHRLGAYRADGSLLVVACSRCGAFADSHLGEHLRTNCLGRFTSAQAESRYKALRTIGRHPTAERRSDAVFAPTPLRPPDAAAAVAV